MIVKSVGKTFTCSSCVCAHSTVVIYILYQYSCSIYLTFMIHVDMIVYKNTKWTVLILGLNLFKKWKYVLSGSRFML